MNSINKWYIKRTPENYIEVNKLYNCLAGTTHKSASGMLFYPKFHGPTLQAAKNEGYVEIYLSKLEEIINTANIPDTDSYTIDNIIGCIIANSNLTRYTIVKGKRGINDFALMSESKTIYEGHNYTLDNLKGYIQKGTWHWIKAPEITPKIVEDYEIY